MNNQKYISFILQFPFMAKQSFTHPKSAFAFQNENSRQDMFI